MPLRAGFLNMMPDKALIVSERHFAELLGAGSGREVRLLRHAVSQIERGTEAAAHLRRHYRDALELKTADLDVLVITGANVSDPHLPGQPFWPTLCEVLDWAVATGLPTLCSCLATHAILAHRHGQDRRPLANKRWGVFAHAGPPGGHDLRHDLLRGLPAVVPVPHSRHNEVGADQMVAAGFEILLASAEAGVHLAVDRAHGRCLLMQGHPEYEAVSLLKEYKREVLLWQAGVRVEYPLPPAGYFPLAGAELAAAYAAECVGARARSQLMPVFPEAELAAGVVNTWTGPAVRIVANWLDALA